MSNSETTSTPVGGYIVTFIHESADGSKVTKTRFIKPEHKNAVMDHLNNKLVLSDADVTSLDEFLKTLA